MKLYELTYHAETTYQEYFGSKVKAFARKAELEKLSKNDEDFYVASIDRIFLVDYISTKHLIIRLLNQKAYVLRRENLYRWSS